jgi:hypothetical protein
MICYSYHTAAEEDVTGDTVTDSDSVTFTVPNRLTRPPEIAP